MLVREARRIKKKRLEDIRKAQEPISFMDINIEICDKHTQKHQKIYCE